MNASARPTRGTVDPEIADEFPGLRLDWLTVAARPGPSDPAVVARLRELASRYRGANVVAMRTRAIPRAYRAFYRQIGLDPEVDRTPAEQVATERLLSGGLRPADQVADACLAALVETGVPVWALDAAGVDHGPPGLGIAIAGDPAVAGSPPAPSGSLVVRDRVRIHALLFGEPSRESSPRSSTAAVLLFSVAVPGVPELHLHEALWIASDLLAGG